MAEQDAIRLRPVPLTRERFARFGDVIDTSREGAAAMNEARFERFHDLCEVDVDGGAVSIGVTRCRAPTTLPLRVDMVERHPHGSQAFVPLTPCRMVVVVAPPGEAVSAADLRAFVSNGRQGINYHKGTWHMPLIAFAAGQEFLVVDRGGPEPNCEEHEFEHVVILEAP